MTNTLEFAQPNLTRQSLEQPGSQPEAGANIIEDTNWIQKLKIYGATVTAIMGFGVTNELAHSAIDREGAQARAERCGGQAYTHGQLLRNWRLKGVTDDVAEKMNISPVNETVASRVNSRFALAIVARPVTVKNNGCKNGELVDAGDKALKPGDREWTDTRTLRGAFPNGFSLRPRVGAKRLIWQVPAEAAPDCSNPHEGKMPAFVWVPKEKKQPPRPPKAVPPAVPPITPPPANPPKETPPPLP